jgi:hypothetical protein
MDQAEFKDQTLLRHLRECREIAGSGRHDQLSFAASGSTNCSAE